MLDHPACFLCNFLTPAAELGSWQSPSSPDPEGDEVNSGMHTFPTWKKPWGGASCAGAPVLALCDASASTSALLKVFTADGLGLAPAWHKTKPYNDIPKRKEARICPSSPLSFLLSAYLERNACNAKEKWIYRHRPPKVCPGKTFYLPCLNAKTANIFLSWNEIITRLSKACNFSCVRPEFPTWNHSHYIQAAGKLLSKTNWWGASSCEKYAYKNNKHNTISN